MAGILDMFSSDNVTQALTPKYIPAAQEALINTADWFRDAVSGEPTKVQQDERGNELIYGSEDKTEVDGFTGASRKTKKVTPVTPDTPLTPDGELIKKDVERGLGEQVQKLQQDQKDTAPPKFPNPVTPDENLVKVTQSKGGYVEGEMPDAEVSGEQPFHTADEYRAEYNNSVGRQNADFNNTNVEWWEDRAFYQGLMRWGMGVLGGEDYGTAFDNATGIYEKEKSRDQREVWAEEMSDDYSPRSIQKWLETGNEADLESYEDMAAEENQRMLNREELAARLSVEDRKELQRLDLQNKKLTNKKLNQQWQWDKEDRKYDTQKSYWDAQKSKYQALKAQGQAAGGGTGKTNKLTEMQAKTGLYGGIMDTVDLNAANRVPTLGEDLTSMATGVLGESAAGRRTADKFKSDEQVATERSRQAFIQGPLRIATGSAYGGQEMADWDNILFPQTNNPNEIRRKQLAQQVVIAQFNNINSGGTEGTIPKDAVSGVASGKYEARIDPQSGALLGVVDPATKSVIFTP